MSGKIAGLVGREAAVMSLLRWILGEFEQIETIRQFESPDNFEKALEFETIDILIMDTESIQHPVFDFIKDLHDKKPNLRTVLVMSPTAKDEIIDIIKANLVKGIVVKPFTKDAVIRYVDKLVR